MAIIKRRDEPSKLRKRKSFRYIFLYFLLTSSICTSSFFSLAKVFTIKLLDKASATLPLDSANNSLRAWRYGLRYLILNLTCKTMNTKSPNNTIPSRGDWMLTIASPVQIDIIKPSVRIISKSCKTTWLRKKSIYRLVSDPIFSLIKKLKSLFINFKKVSRDSS